MNTIKLFRTHDNIFFYRDITLFKIYFNSDSRA